MPVCASCSDGTSCDTCIPSRKNLPNCNQAADGFYDDGNTDSPFPRKINNNIL